jgi:hypothetical protein
MILLATDYSSTAELTAAIDTYLSNAADIYVTKATYDISRGCDQTDFFINVLHHQVKNGYQDRVQFSGFEDYTPPPPTHSVTYLNGFNTAYGVQPSSYTEGAEITITVISGNSNVQILNTDITLNFGAQSLTATANAQGTATFTFTPTTSGSVTVTSALAEAASNAIALGYHGEVIDTSVYSLEASAAYGLSRIVNSNLAVGDGDGDGAAAVNDLTQAISMGAISRKAFTKHATVELGSLFYNPGVGGTLSYTISPVGTSYTYSSANYVGASKSINDLRYSYIIVDSDGDPSAAGEAAVTHAPNTLSSDGSFTGAIPISTDFNNPLLVVFALRNAYNNVVLSSQSTAGLTASITSGSSFEPGDTITVTFADDTNALAEVDGSFVYVQAFDNSNTIGSALMSAQGLVGVGNTASVTLSVPDSLDQDVFLKTGYAFYDVTNAITVEYLSDSLVEVPTVMTVTTDVAHYTTQLQVITITVAMVNSATRTDYELSISAVEGSLVQALVTADSTDTSTYTFVCNQGNLIATDSIVLKVSVSEAD